MTLLSVGSELPYFGNVRTVRTVLNEDVAFDKFLEQNNADVSVEPEPLTENLTPDFGGGTHLGRFAQAMSPSTEPETGVAAYLKVLEFKFGDIALLNVPDTKEGIGNLVVDLAGMGNIIIAENILKTMAAFPGKAAYYEAKIRRFAAAPLATLPQVQALLSGLGLDNITLSALVIHTDGKIRYLFGGEESSREQQVPWRSLLANMSRNNGDNAGTENTSSPLSPTDVQVFQEALSAAEGTQSFVMAGIFMIVSFLEGLPRPRQTQPRRNRKRHNRVEGVAPRRFISRQRQK